MDDCTEGLSFVAKAKLKENYVQRQASTGSKDKRKKTRGASVNKRSEGRWLCSRYLMNFEQPLSPRNGVGKIGQPGEGETVVGRGEGVPVQATKPNDGSAVSGEE